MSSENSIQREQQPDTGYDEARRERRLLRSEPVRAAHVLIVILDVAEDDAPIVFH